MPSPYFSLKRHVLRRVTRESHPDHFLLHMKAWFSRLPFRRVFWIVLGIGLFCVAYLVLWDLPIRYTASVTTEEAASRVVAENSLRATLAQILLGLGIFVGLYLTYRRIRATERQAKAAEDGQLTERFSRAIEHLGKPGEEHTAIRLGGIYALERILRDSDADAPTVQEVLAAFVRDESVARYRALDPNDQLAFRFSSESDLQAALTVLSRNPVANRRIDLQGAYLAGAKIVRGQLHNAILQGIHLDGADLREAYLEFANLKEASLTSANLEGANLEGANLEEANLLRANLSGANLLRANFREANLSRANLQGANLRGVSLDGVNLVRASLKVVNLEGGILQGCNVAGANLEGANLVGAKFRRGQFYGVRSLEGAILREANLEEAYLAKMNLGGANLEGANLKGANLRSADLKEARLGRPRRRWALSTRELYGRATNLGGADLLGANLEGADLWGANLQGANLERANLEGADLRGANLQGANLEKANLEKANLDKANLKGTLLE